MIKHYEKAVISQDVIDGGGRRCVTTGLSRISDKL